MRKIGQLKFNVSQHVNKSKWTPTQLGEQNHCVTKHWGPGFSAGYVQQMRGKANLLPLPTALYSEKTDNLILCRLRHASAQVNAISLGRQVLHRIGLGGFLFGLVFFHFIKKNCPWAKPKQREKEIFTFGLHFDVIHTQRIQSKSTRMLEKAAQLSIQGNGSARTRWILYPMLLLRSVSPKEVHKSKQSGATLENPGPRIMYMCQKLSPLVLTCQLSMVLPILLPPRSTFSPPSAPWHLHWLESVLTGPPAKTYWFTLLSQQCQTGTEDLCCLNTRLELHPWVRSIRLPTGLYFMESPLFWSNYFRYWTHNIAMP